MSRTILHLSDIHFGTVDPAILAPLIDAAHGLAPHVVVVSGDLTQRARTLRVSGGARLSRPAATASDRGAWKP